MKKYDIWIDGFFYKSYPTLKKAREVKENLKKKRWVTIKFPIQKVNGDMYEQDTRIDTIAIILSK